MHLDNPKSQNDLASIQSFVYIVGTMWSNFTGRKPIIFAPMAGISDSPARQLARRHGADITVSELISAEGVIRDCHRTWELARFDNSERPIGLQIFGANPVSMAKAAFMLSELKPDFIDINFGCPARKIVGKNGGSSVLRDLGLLERIVGSVVQAVDLPVTVKMRSGWDSEELTYLEAGKAIENAGATAVAIHPRTRTQGFSGRADWEIIKTLKENVGIKVIGNGDITCPQDAARMFAETGCDAIMVGRAAIGNHWIFNRIKHYLATGECHPEPTSRQRITGAIEHFEMAVDQFGLPHAVYKMRSQICHYINGLRGSGDIRVSINRLLSPNEIKELLLDYGDSLEREDYSLISQAT